MAPESFIIVPILVAIKNLLCNGCKVLSGTIEADKERLHFRVFCYHLFLTEQTILLIIYCPFYVLT